MIPKKSGKKQRVDKIWRFDWNIYQSQEAKCTANFLGLALSPYYDKPVL